MAAGPLIAAAQGGWIVPLTSPLDIAVAPNYEKFDGQQQLDKPTGLDPGSRPGAGQTPLDLQTYTKSSRGALTNTLGGQPLPVSDRIHRGPGSTTPAHPVNMQFRSGVGQNNQGVAQTVALASITTNPPQPGDLTSIISGMG